jgi:hypothetical protein
MNEFNYTPEYCNIITPPDTISNNFINVLCLNIVQEDVIRLADLCKTAKRSYNFYLWHEGNNIDWKDKLLDKADVVIADEVVDPRYLKYEINTGINNITQCFEHLENKEIE